MNDVEQYVDSAVNSACFYMSVVSEFSAEPYGLIQHGLLVCEKMYKAIAVSLAGGMNDRIMRTHSFVKLQTLIKDHGYDDTIHSSLCFTLDTPNKATLADIEAFMLMCVNSLLCVSPHSISTKIATSFTRRVYESISDTLVLHRYVLSDMMTLLGGAI